MNFEHRGQNQNVDLPADIIDEILSWLPVKPLCRFRCVSKPWRSRISDPNFIAMHSSKAIEHKDVFFQRVKLVFSGLLGGFYSLDLENHGDGSTATYTELDFVGWTPYMYCTPSHTSNRFLFFQTKRSFYLITNPATGESKKVPKAPSPTSSACHYGFGFDHSTNLYEVVNVQQQNYTDGLVFSVYTVEASSSWRRVEGVYPYDICSTRTGGVFLHGCVHWLGKRDRDGELVIISFHLAKEEVQEIALPPICSIGALGVFRNWLCITLSREYDAERNTEFWVMKEYGVRDSWTKQQFSIPYDTRSHSGFWTESHDLMVFDKKSLVMYNFSDGTYWNLDIDNEPCFGGFADVSIYVESLASLTDEEEELGASKEDR